MEGVWHAKNTVEPQRKVYMVTERGGGGGRIVTATFFFCRIIIEAFSTFYVNSAGNIITHRMDKV